MDLQYHRVMQICLCYNNQLKSKYNGTTNIETNKHEKYYNLAIQHKLSN